MCLSVDIFTQELQIIFNTVTGYQCYKYYFLFHWHTRLNKLERWHLESLPLSIQKYSTSRQIIVTG